MPENSEEHTLDRLDAEMLEAFEEAYPDVPLDDLHHIAKNFIQVVRGVINIGQKMGGDLSPTHMDVANSMVYWCVMNTRLEDMQRGDPDRGIEDPGVSRISETDMVRLKAEFVARTADWLLGMEVLRGDPELYETFIKGAAALGAEGWERNRGDLNY